MPKKDLIQKIADRAGLTQKQVNDLAQALTAVVIESAKAGMMVRLFDLCNIEIGQSAAKTARNPRTGEEVHVPAKTKLKFKSKVKEEELK